MSKPTDTPETDNHEIYADIGDDSEQGDWAYVVPSDFARTLERRNAELTKQNKVMEQNVTDVYELNRTLLKQRAELTARIAELESSLAEARKDGQRMRALELAANGLRDALHEADDDIREHVQVARYNLTGEMNTGDKITPPNPPLLIHAAGIEASEKRRAKIQSALAAFAALQPKETHE